jgi:hypothetical protein
MGQDPPVEKQCSVLNHFSRKRTNFIRTLFTQLYHFGSFLNQELGGGSAYTRVRTVVNVLKIVKVSERVLNATKAKKVSEF